MPYNFYLILHLFSAFCIMAIGAQLCLSDKYSKKLAGLYGALCLILFVAGFGLLAKGQYSLSSGWASTKLAAFLVLAAGVPIIAKRFQNLKKIALYTQFGLLFVVIYMAILKPI